MARIGYARVSTTDQDLTVQQDRLRAEGCDIIRSEGAITECPVLLDTPLLGRAEPMKHRPESLEDGPANTRFRMQFSPADHSG